MSVPKTARGRSRRRSTVRPPMRAAAAALAPTDTRDRRAVPGDGALDPFAQRCSRLEAEELPRTSRVDASARLAVRLLLIPRDAALVSRHVGDELGEVLDGDLMGRAEIDRLGAVEAFRGQHESLDTVVDVQELARRRSVAPEHDLVVR